MSLRWFLYFKIQIWEGGDEIQICFFSFGYFLTKCNINGSLNVKNLCFWLNITLFATVALINKIVSFSFSIATFDNEKNFFNKIMNLINPNYHWKNGVKQVKINLEKLLQICICYPLLRTQTFSLIFANNCHVTLWIGFRPLFLKHSFLPHFHYF